MISKLVLAVCILVIVGPSIVPMVEGYFWTTQCGFTHCYEKEPEDFEVIVKECENYGYVRKYEWTWESPTECTYEKGAEPGFQFTCCPKPDEKPSENQKPSEIETPTQNQGKIKKNVIEIVL